MPRVRQKVFKRQARHVHLTRLVVRRASEGTQTAESSPSAIGRWRVAASTMMKRIPKGTLKVPTSVEIQDSSTTMGLRPHRSRTPSRVVTPSSTTPNSHRGGFFKRSLLSPRRHFKRGTDHRLGIAAAPFHDASSSSTKSSTKQPAATASDDEEMVIDDSSSSGSSCNSHRLGIQRCDYKYRPEPELDLSKVQKGGDENEIVFEKSPEKEKGLFEHAWDSDQDDFMVQEEDAASEEPVAGFAGAFPLAQDAPVVIQPSPVAAAAAAAAVTKPPVVVQQNMGPILAVGPATQETDDSPEKYIHEPTAKKHYRSLPSPRKSPRRRLLSSPRKSPRTRNSDANPPSSPLKTLRRNINKGIKSVTSAKRKSKTALTKVEMVEEPSTPNQTETAMKIFVLLLQPQSKLFELIQLVYPASTTTVGGVLAMIPEHATEPTLARQHYVGISRPKKRSPDFTDTSLLASRADIHSVGLEQGEIIIALPLNYNHDELVRLGKKILANTRIQKLLQESSSNQTAEQKRSTSSKTRRWASPNASPALSHAVNKTKVMEEDKSPAEYEESMKRALEQASAANAEVKEVEAPKQPAPVPSSASAGDNSTNSSLRSSGSMLGRRTRVGVDTSFDGSTRSKQSTVVSRKSKGMARNTSFASLSSHRPKVVRAGRKHQRSQFLASFLRVTVLLMVTMSLRFYTDPNGYAARQDPVSIDQSLGLIGGLQVFLVFYLLVKFQRSFPVDDSERPVRWSR